MARYRLTESRLRNIIREAVKSALTEEEIPGNIPINPSMIPYAQYDPKKAEEIASWDALDKDLEQRLYQSKPVHGSGYWDDYTKPDIENMMYKSMGNPSQYATAGELQNYAPNKEYGGYHMSPTRNPNIDGHLGISALSDNDYDDTLTYMDFPSGASGSRHLTNNPSYSRDPKNFRNGVRNNVEDLLSQKAMQDNISVWNGEEDLRRMGG